MIKYDIKSLMQNKTPRIVQLPIILPTLTNERDYLKALRAMLRSLVQSVKSDILPAYKSSAKLFDAKQHDDLNERSFTSSRLLSNYLAGVAITTVKRILSLEAKRHSKTFVQSAKSSLGIDISSVVSDADLSAYLEAAALKNAGLIRGLSDDAIKRIQYAVLDAHMKGLTVKILQKVLSEQFGILDRRAKFIASDQLSKLNAGMNKFRHKQAGIEQYIWRDSHDERVRPLHRSLEGKQYKYDEPTGAEGGLAPGEPPRCRCIAQAIVEF